jgi:RNA ligase
MATDSLGLRLASFPKEVQRFIFPYRKSGGDLLSGRTRDLVFRSIRPDGNVLDGYAPSSSVNRVMNEAA